METPPSVSSDVNCVRGNKTRCQIAPKHNLQASCEVKQRQSTVFASQGKVPMAGMEEQQLSSTGGTHQRLWELFVQQLQGWADCPLTKTGRAGPGQETAPRVQLCSNSRFPLIAGEEASPALECPSLLLTYRSTQLLNGEAAQTKPNICSPSFNPKYLQMLNLHAKIT